MTRHRSIERPRGTPARGRARIRPVRQNRRSQISYGVPGTKGNDSVVKRYNSDGSLKEVEDARGNITKYEYNGFKGLKKTIYPNYSEPNDNREEVTYDQYRRVSQTRGRSGQTIEFTYDDAGRVATKTVKKPDTSTFNTITYTYDLLGRLYEVEDKTGTTKNTFDKAGRLVRVEYPGSKTVAYQYDAAGNRTRLTYPDSTYVTYDYDDIYQITDVNYPVGFDYLAKDTEFNYDEAGNRTTVIVDGSETTTYQTNNLNQYTAAGPDSFQYDDSGNMWADGHNVYTFDPENRLLTARPSGQSPPPGSALAEAVDSGLSYTTGGDANWQKVNYPYHYGDDAAEGTAWRNGNSWLATEVEGAGTLKFWWKVSSESGGDYLEFYIDDQLQSNPISGEQDWAEKTYTITGSSTHTLRWQYTKDDDDTTEGDDRGWVDYVQWSGQQPQPEEWDQVEYVYDPSGRRIEKKYDGATVYKYVYDGDHCIAEYDGSNNLARKYLYGPAVDEPVCMIEAAGAYAGTYYYHFDALGSVVALSDSSGDTVAVYEYDVYGRVGASDANHPNRFLFTGREYDQETGLYYYRARYYNPQIGRFLQTDPIGYGAGMNMYAYGGNNSTNMVDPSGLYGIFLDQDDPGVVKDADGNKLLTFAWVHDDGKVEVLGGFASIERWKRWAMSDRTFGGRDNSTVNDRAGWELSGGNWGVFWSIQASIALTKNLVRDVRDPAYTYDLEWEVRYIEGQTYRNVKWGLEDVRGPLYDAGTWATVRWNPGTGLSQIYNEATDRPPYWWKAPDLATLMHEIGHAYQDALGTWSSASEEERERFAMFDENVGRYAYYRRVPGSGRGQSNQVWARPAYGFYSDDQSVFHPDVAWENWNWRSPTLP